MSTTTIRTAVAGDLERFKELAVAANMFSAAEVGFFDEMVHGALDGSMEGHQWFAVESDTGRVVAAAQFAPEPFADRMWNLSFIAVDPTDQGTGVGSALMAHIEDQLRDRGESIARTLIVETSSTDQYARTRDFYAKLGYDEEATIRDFYAPGDHKVVFWKSIIRPPERTRRRT